MALLEVKDLKVSVADREILHGLTLTVNEGEVHAIMGPNGSGKSTLAHVLSGKPGYEVTDGQVLLDGDDLLALGYREGPVLGAALARLLDLVVDDPDANVPDVLLAEARQWLP